MISKAFHFLLRFWCFLALFVVFNIFIFDFACFVCFLNMFWTYLGICWYLFNMFCMVLHFLVVLGFLRLKNVGYQLAPPLTVLVVCGSVNSSPEYLQESASPPFLLLSLLGSPWINCLDVFGCGGFKSSAYMQRNKIIN